ncbi:nitroimidazol reductase NimA-like FMN-containing flavoprotein (pyridoxamine 5'-phosphate oxidase superfamily) [Sedimentibacter acidaminivorans]|uniref:Nitroimidazol reductase NimA-like FMN-containing flavoprotein (Pyridoxamine 5'-phosphate oxidase superfamily) n=1 Tax=Sedimentibacter acidaminivorans TaxID=913099 RepID=A0ABS4GAQ1_9FIRM|nr:pyridoxamine 5'-phosphate oxidase family protein [Sedimentibacter acidaminivorans]MBP1924744.1 nitroimidazol reductase NimA-like FMN-containing flavoprotein (pyridoxamine 5'-phosphate oxidase superfamily) [Sedimentibacter acidaminivorans]
MFKEMRRSDKMLSNEEMLDIMKTTEFGILSTIGKNGFPYGVPVNFVYKDNYIYFHAALTGHKLENISFNNKVSFCVVKDVELIPDDFNTKFKSVIAFGEVEEVSEDKKNEIFILILEKFSKDFMKPGIEYVKKSGSSAKIFAIKIEHITAKGKK